jgi:hypothetical protein
LKQKDIFPEFWKKQEESGCIFMIIINFDCENIDVGEDLFDSENKEY